MVLRAYFVMVLILGAQAEDQQLCHVTPEELAGQVIGHVSFIGDLSGWSEEDRLAYLQQFDIQARVAEIVPEGVFARSPEAAQAILASSRVALRFNDAELTRLTLEKAIMDQVLILKQTTLLPSLDRHDRDALERTVRETLSRAEVMVKKHLASVVPRAMITDTVQSLAENLVKETHNPNTYWMKQPPDPEKLDAFLVVFEDRLALSRDRAIRRLEHADQLLREDRPGNSDTDIDWKNREMEEILEETLRPLRKALLTATSPPELLELNKNPDHVLPGYSDTVRRWLDRQRFVAKAWQKARQEQRRAAQSAARLAKEFQLEAGFAAEKEVRNLDLDALPVTAHALESGPVQEPLSSRSMRSSPDLVAAVPAAQGEDRGFFLVLGLAVTCVVTGLTLVFRRPRVSQSKRDLSTPAT